MAESPVIQWYPGHMKKTERLIEKHLHLVDIIVEVADARIPLSSRNPNLGYIIKQKSRILLLNKSDLADPLITEKWLQYYKKKGMPALAIDCKSSKGIKDILPKVRKILEEIIQKRKDKGQLGRALRLMIVGIPNAGKSSLINKMAGSKRTKVEDRPGVTRGKQWVTLDHGIELLDMPGVLWPKFEDPKVGEHLAFTGAVKDNVIDIELLAMRLLELLSKEYPHVLENRYHLNNTDSMRDFERLEALGRKRGMLISGGEINTERAAIMLLDEYRSGKLGKISFEYPPYESEK